MQPMPLALDATDVAIRIAACLVAGAIIGLNRGESGKAAGLRTTMLVSLAACLAMLQVNALLAQAGKTAQSFVVLDLMRLPLGILSGVGFIGAGAILRRDGLVTGLTTAATLWFVTVIGLCAGAGQLALAALATVIGFAILTGAKALERRLPHTRRAWMSIDEPPGMGDAPRTQDVLERLRALRCRVLQTGTQRDPVSGLVRRRFDLAWTAPGAGDPVERAIDAFVCDSVGAANWSIKE